MIVKLLIINQKDKNVYIIAHEKSRKKKKEIEMNDKIMNSIQQQNQLLDQLNQVMKNTHPKSQEQIDETKHFINKQVKKNTKKNKGIQSNSFDITYKGNQRLLSHVIL